MEILGAALKRAIPAQGVVVGVDEVTLAGASDKVSRELEACLARRRVKVGGLVRRAADHLMGEGGREDAADPVGAGVEPVELSVTISIRRGEKGAGDVPSTSKKR